MTAGLGGMGGAQPLAATMNGAVALVAEVDPERIEKRRKTRYLDEHETDLDSAIDRALAAKAQGQAISIGVEANAVDLLERLIARDVLPDLVTDQTSAHDELNGYVPRGGSLAELERLRASDPARYIERSYRTMADHVRALLELQRRGAIVFDYGNNLRGQALKAGVADAFAIGGFVPLYIRPLFCEGKGPFRWAALSGEPEDIFETDRALLELFPEDRALARWLALARERIAFQGLPARICWLGYGERHRAGLRFNELVREGRVRAPIVIGRDHLDAGSVASPNRETEAMKDGSDAIADWPILNALLNTAAGATWVSVHHGGGVGIGYSIHAGMVVVADGTEDGLAAVETGVVERSRHGSDAPRRRRLSRGGARGARAGSGPAVPRLRRHADTVRRRALLAAVLLAAPLLLWLDGWVGRFHDTRRAAPPEAAVRAVREVVADLQRRAASLAADPEVARSMEGGGIAVRRQALFSAAREAMAGAPAGTWIALADRRGDVHAWWGDAPSQVIEARRPGTLGVRWSATRMELVHWRVAGTGPLAGLIGAARALPVEAPGFGAALDLSGEALDWEPVAADKGQPLLALAGGETLVAARHAALPLSEDPTGRAAGFALLALLALFLLAGRSEPAAVGAGLAIGLLGALLSTASRRGPPVVLAGGVGSGAGRGPPAGGTGAHAASRIGMARRASPIWRVTRWSLSRTSVRPASRFPTWARGCRSGARRSWSSWA